MNSVLFLVSLLHIASLSAAHHGWYNDREFFLWCGGLTCKQTNRESVSNVTPRQFLGIDETNIHMNFFYRPHNQSFSDATIATQEVKYEVDGIRDKRLLGRWRLLEDNTGKNLISSEERKLSLSKTRDHREYLLYHSLTSCGCCEPHQGEKIKLYANSIPCDDRYYLYGGTCADKSENVWVTADPLALLKSSSGHFSLAVLWVSKCKKPCMLHEFKIPAKTYEIVHNSVAIKFSEDEAEFQLLYDASDKKTEYVEAMRSTEGKGCSITIMSPVVYQEPPSLWTLTFTLDRVQKHKDNIGKELLQRWYATFMKLKMGTMTEQELIDVKTEMRAVVDACDRNVI